MKPKVINTNPQLKSGTANNDKPEPLIQLEMTDIVNTDEAFKNHYLLRIQELEEINVNLQCIAEDQKKKLDEMAATNSKFVSIIAHDLRGPFTSILGVLDLLKEKLEDYDAKEINKFLGIASDSASRTLILLNNLLAWTISQNKGKSFDPAKINLYEEVSFELENIQVQAAQKQIVISHSIVPSLHVTADLQMVKTILRNLIHNAVKYTNTNGAISISAVETTSFVEISVKDNGIGMSARTRHHLFKMNEFQSLTGTGNEKGTGLGLLLCKEFVEMHGGTIRVKSAPGKGSEFTFTLPHYI